MANRIDLLVAFLKEKIEKFQLYFHLQIKWGW